MNNAKQSLTNDLLNDAALMDDKPSLLEDTRGSGFVEKIVILGLFVFAAAAGVSYLGTSANTAMQNQGDTIGGINSSL